jgi:hypothetical protein
MNITNSRHIVSYRGQRKTRNSVNGHGYDRIRDKADLENTPLHASSKYGKIADTAKGYKPDCDHFFIWGCRVSTGGQIEELQAEVSVCTLVKQPTKQ